MCVQSYVDNNIGSVSTASVCHLKIDLRRWGCRVPLENEVELEPCSGGNGSTRLAAADVASVARVVK